MPTAVVGAHGRHTNTQVGSYIGGRPPLRTRIRIRSHAAILPDPKPAGRVRNVSTTNHHEALQHRASGQACWPACARRVAGRVQTERPVGLRPHVEAEFARAHVSIDFAGFSGETLHGVLIEPLDKISARLLTPESVSIRILIPDTRAPMALPCLAETRIDDPGVRQWAERISRRHTDAIAEAVREFGFYPVIEHTVTIDGKPTSIYDPMGKDTILFHRAISDGETSDTAQYVEQARAWFEPMWSTIAYDYTP